MEVTVCYETTAKRKIQLVITLMLDNIKLVILLIQWRLQIYNFDESRKIQVGNNVNAG